MCVVRDMYRKSSNGTAPPSDSEVKAPDNGDMVWVCCCSGVGRQQDAEAGIQQPAAPAQPLVAGAFWFWICRSLPCPVSAAASGRGRTGSDRVFMPMGMGLSRLDGTRQLIRSGRAAAASSCAARACTRGPSCTMSAHGPEGSLPSRWTPCDPLREDRRGARGACELRGQVV